jgi:hypothetical protein
MTAIQRNRTNSDIDDRTEREICTRGAWIAKVNKGGIVPRWVDVMPQVDARGLLESSRVARRMAQTVSSPEPTQEPASTRDSARRAMERQWYHDRRARNADRIAEMRAQREAEKARRRTPEQQKRHDAYEARKARKE